MNLLTYEEALNRMLDEVKPLTVAFESTEGIARTRAIAEDLIATEPYPRFDNSGVDGYAVHEVDCVEGRVLKVSGAIAAGSNEKFSMAPGQAARILTGARIPKGTAAVVMQEDVERSGDSIRLIDSIAPGRHIRRAGAEFGVGDTIAAQGTPATPGLLALLADQNKVKFPFYLRPKIAIVTTGDELVSVGQALGPGQIRDTVGPMLEALAGDFGVVVRTSVRDDPDKLSQALEAAAADVIFVSGGASVGDRDYLERVVASLGEVVFHGVRIRPGKPVLFGTVGGKPLLGLPGNPGSAFVCFSIFGVPMLRKMSGWSEPRLAWRLTPFEAKHEPYSRDVFVRVEFRDGRARPVGEQSSFGLRSLALGQGLAWLAAEKPVESGDLVLIAAA